MTKTCHYNVLACHLLSKLIKSQASFVNHGLGHNKIL